MKRFYLLPIVCCALSISLSAQENNGTATTSGADDNRILSADSLITTDARLDSLYQTLPEVMITGERPIVKAAQGKLVYALPRLIRNLPVDNAYDAVKELPGVIEMNGGLQLAGQGVTVILDGKVTTLSTEQLYSLLRSIPASRIEKAEVMYNAPARYQVRGALINITLKQSAGGPDSMPSIARSITKALRNAPACSSAKINSQQIFFTRTAMAGATLLPTKRLCTPWQTARFTP